jgi:hypothetical protein
MSLDEIKKSPRAIEPIENVYIMIVNCNGFVTFQDLSQTEDGKIKNLVKNSPRGRSSSETPLPDLTEQKNRDEIGRSQSSPHNKAGKEKKKIGILLFWLAYVLFNS